MQDKEISSSVDQMKGLDDACGVLQQAYFTSSRATILTNHALLYTKIYLSRHYKMAHVC